MQNPLTQPLFWPLALAIGGFLAVAFIYTLVSERKNLKTLHKSSLFHRWASSAVLAPLAVLCLLSGTIAITAMATGLAVIGMLEYFHVVKLSPVFIPTALVAGIAVPVVAAAAPQWVMPVMVFALLAIGTIAVCEYGKDIGQNAGSPDQKSTATAGDADRFVLSQAALAVLSIAYIPLLASYIIHVSQLNGGTGILLALIAAIGLSDTMAFVCGKMFGRTKLAPRVSPNKTVAGAVGNLIGAYTGFLALQFACPPLPLWVLAVLPLFIAAAAVFGDLFESVIKRSFKVKDAGTWLPGFGGLLDRVDSLLFVMPVSYYLLALAI